MAKEPVEVVPYDPTWPLQFGRLADRARLALSGIPARIEHVGSTAVPGLHAKPIIDIDIIVAPHDVARACAHLATIGYRHEGNKGIPGRDSMHWPTGELRHHLYVCADDAPALRDHLVFRDVLRRDNARASEYSALKQSLALQYRDQRESYQSGKDAFVARLLAEHASLVRVRRATEHDGAQLASLGRATYPAYFAHVWSPASLTAYVEREYGETAIRSQLRSTDFTWWIAEEGGVCVGYAKVRHDRPVPITGEPGVELDKCYVAVGQTGKGIGAALLRAVIDQASMFAPRRLWLGVLTTNEAAQRMYARNGFVPAGTMPLRTDREIGCVVMVNDRSR
jgi:GrpB-like predicted nucleotidyltransferase (UPF0157 family)/GNAT superfamily N-acetyltransferase